MRVLIIGHDRETTEYLKGILQASIRDVLTVNSADQGVVLAKEHSPDLIILDMMLGGAGGIKLCQELRKMTGKPILVLSPLNNPENIIGALEAGADDYLIKPISNTILLIHINKLLRYSKVNSQTLSLAGC